MIKNECEIVKDLLPNYIEKAFSKSTNEFIEVHIRQCTDCKKILEYLESEKVKEKDQNVQDENLQINYLKKYHRKITILKWLVAILIIILSAIWAYMLGGYIKNIKFQNDYKTGEYYHQIIETACQKVEELKNENNFSLMIRNIDGEENSETTYYYRNGLGRWKIKSRMGDRGIISYGINLENGGYCMVVVDSQTKEPLEVKKFERGDIKDYLMALPAFPCDTLNRFHRLNISESLSLEIREEMYEEDVCYVARQQLEEEYYYEIWLEKESLLPVREIQKRYNHYEEYLYTYTINNVTDEEVRLDEKALNSNYWFEDTDRNEMKELILSRYNELCIV